MLRAAVRGYATRARSLPPLRPSAFSARTGSTPQAVRERRSKRFGLVEASQSDAARSGLSPTDRLKYRRLRALKKLPRLPGTDREPNEREWHALINESRNRVRGFVDRTRPDGTPFKQVVGMPVYLPNVVFTMMRNFTPKGGPYNPYEATFHIPSNITKTDVRSYLLAIYGLKTTYIRTFLTHSPFVGESMRLLQDGIIPKRKAKKVAVVGLVDPFYFPWRMEDLSEEDREKRKEWIRLNFGPETGKKYGIHPHIERYRLNPDANFYDNIERKAERTERAARLAERRRWRAVEEQVAHTAGELQTMRESGDQVTYESLRESSEDKSNELKGDSDRSGSSPVSSSL